MKALKRSSHYKYLPKAIQKIANTSSIPWIDIIDTIENLLITTKTPPKPSHEDIHERIAELNTSLTKQIAEGIIKKWKDRHKNIVISLTPGFLGSASVNFSQMNAGILSIMLESSSTKEILHERPESLIKALERKGLKCSEIHFLSKEKENEQNHVSLKGDELFAKTASVHEKRYEKTKYEKIKPSDVLEKSDTSKDKKNILVTATDLNVRSQSSLGGNTTAKEISLLA